MRAVHRFVMTEMGYNARMLSPRSIHFVGHSLGTAISTALASELCRKNLAPGSLTLMAPFTDALSAATTFPLTQLFLWPLNLLLPSWTGNIEILFNWLIL